MPMKKYKPEQIVTLLRQIEVENSQRRNYPASLPPLNHKTSANHL
jgi:hypothetical protein